MYNYALFDLDGTLTDSGFGIINCVKYAIRRLSLPMPSDDVLKSFVGPPLKEHFAEVLELSDEKAERALSLYRERYAPIGIFENRVYDGVPEMLKRLIDCGITCAVATSKPEKFAQQILEHFELSKYFACVTGCEMNGDRITKEEVIKESLLRLSASTHSCIMIGDRRYDIEAAKKIGLSSLAVTYGYAPSGELEACIPDYYANNPTDVAGILTLNFTE